MCILYYIVAMFWSFLCNCVQNHPKLRVVDPLDYEGQLITRRKDLEHEKYLNLFPQQDVTVGVVMWMMSGAIWLNGGVMWLIHGVMWLINGVMW